MQSHGRSDHNVLLEHERSHGSGMDALVTICSWNTSVLVVWHGCSGDRMFFEREVYHGLGMDALVTVHAWNTHGIIVWAWMLW